MLYLEDFLELIESFPHELKDRLLEIKDLDSHVQNETEKLDVRADGFFTQCKKQKTDWKTENFENIKKEYVKLLETVDDKVQITNQLNDLIDKYLKKLDQEIHKFKLELEADHAGITSKLEKTVSTQNQNFEVYNEDVFNSLIDDKSHLYDQFDTYANIYSPVNVNDSSTFQFNPHSYNSHPSISHSSMLRSQLSSNLLRTPSVSSNMSAGGLFSGDLLRRTSSSIYKRPVTHLSSNTSLIESSNLGTVQHRSRIKKPKLDKFEDELDDEEFYDDESSNQFAADDVDSSVASGDSSTITNDKQFKEDLSEDPNEEVRYCMCKDVSYGDMILCDNRRCQTQWFHFTCVGLNAAPKGKWFCPRCVDTKKKRKEKQQLNGTFTSNYSTNSNDGMPTTASATTATTKLTSSSAADIYNDDFDFKFQMPKIFSNNKKQQKQQQQNDATSSSSSSLE